MDTETAIKEIKDRIELEWRHRFPADLAPDYIEALKLAVEALEKQKTKKPYKYRTEGDMSQDVYDCRECGTVITLNDTYCRRCGRVQMWED